MFQKTYGGGLCGIDGYVIEAEADVCAGLPQFSMVGYLSAEVKEAQERVRTALRNAGFELEAMKVTVNLSPANVRKEGTACDLAVAAAVLAAYGLVRTGLLSDSAFLGELGLDGQVKPVCGILSMVLAMKERGLVRCFVPAENVPEGLAAEGIDIVGVKTLAGLAGLLNRPEEISPAVKEESRGNGEFSYEEDFSEVNGQLLLRRAAEVAAAGRHNLLFIGPPGSGKSMIARRIPTILPGLSHEEQLEVSKVYSICGLLPKDTPLMRHRPFRAPHHTISPQALIGGGRVPRPGELSLASGGVLFLDELTEFQRRTLETLRQPLEEGKVTISRIWGTVDFPARCEFVAATNPCPCGYYPDRRRCTCTRQQVQTYLGKISRPLLDRIDICVEAAPVTYQEIRGHQKNESSADIRRRVAAACAVQKERFAGKPIHFNGEMGGKEIERYCKLKQEDEAYLEKIYSKFQMSARGCHKLLKVARTIADLAGAQDIGRIHLQEAFGYRTIEEQYWGGGEAGL